MPELLKNRYNKEYIHNLATKIAEIKTDFDTRQFNKNIFDKSWPQKALKERMIHISEQIHLLLQGDYKSNISVLTKIAADFAGFEGMFIPHYIQTYGLNDWQTSIKALEKTTKYASAEFSVRQFILKDKERMMAQMLIWSKHKNYHVRRLASEGCRPRLPWACALPEFKQDPRLIIPILDQLKNDDSLYVRRSVANNINDISKDNPNLVLDLVRLWQGQNSEQDWILKHGARTLLKRSDKTTLRLFGNEAPKHVQLSDFNYKNTVKIEEKFAFEFSLQSKKALGKLRLEYKIGFVKSSGKVNYKVFKISENNYQKNALNISKQHSFKQLSTRKHYPGQHEIIILINGIQLASGSFQVTE